MVNGATAAPQGSAKTRIAPTAAAVLLPVGAWILQAALWDLFEPLGWVLLYPAVFAAAWIGGLRAGLAATALAAVLGWWCFVPPEYAFWKHPKHLIAPGVFVGTGVLCAFIHDRAKRATRRAAEAAARAGVEAMRAHKEWLELAESVAGVGAFEWDIQAGEGFWSKEIEALYGMEPGTFEGTFEAWTRRIHPDDREQAATACMRSAETGEDFDHEFRVVLPDGEIRWLHGRCKILRDTSGRPHRMIGVNVDVTARKLAAQDRDRAHEEALAARRQSEADLEVMTRLHKVSSLLLPEGCALESVLTEIIDAAIAIAGADFGVIQLVDPASSELKIAAHRGLPAWWVEFWSRSASHGACGLALERGARVVIDDVEQSPLFAGTPGLEIQRRAGVRAVQSTPLVSRSGKPVGMFSTHYKQPHRPDERALRALDLLSHQAAEVIERIRMDDALRESERRYFSLFESSPFAMALTRIPDATVVAVNGAFLSLFELAREEVLGKTAALLSADPASYAALRAELLARGSVRGFEYRRSTKAGASRVLSLNLDELTIGGQEHVLAIASDITEQKRLEVAQRVLADAGGVLSSTLEEAQALTTVARLIVRDLADLCIVDVALETGEVQRSPVVSRDPALAWACELIAQLPRDPGCPGLVGLVSCQPVLMPHLTPEEVSSWPGTEEQRRALRAVDPRALIAVPLQIRDRCFGAITLVSSTRGYDAADVRLAEELARRVALSIENARLYDTARRATQLRDEMLGIVAHDLRNPLGLIRLQAALLRERVGEAVRKPTEVIDRSARRMDRLIQDLLDVTRLERAPLRLELAPLSPERLALDVAEAQRALAASASIALEVDVARDLPEVLADRDRLLQIFENLVGNALRFTERGGRIAIGAALREGEVVFWVSDTGSGIAPEDLPRVFDRFWQARSARSAGAGLGLAIVKGLVEAHGGRVWVESTPGRGCTFYLTIPIAGSG